MRSRQKSITSEIVVDICAPLGHNDERLITVVEAPHYIKRAEKILSMEERDMVIDEIARNPLSGAVIAGMGGVRKLRFSKGSRGKSGGVRVIYYHHDYDNPILLMDIYGKNEKDNLSKSERNAMAAYIANRKRSMRK